MRRRAPVSLSMLRNRHRHFIGGLMNKAAPFLLPPLLPLPFACSCPQHAQSSLGPARSLPFVPMCNCLTPGAWDRGDGGFPPSPEQGRVLPPQALSSNITTDMPDRSRG